jgi:hypothetical protein
MPDRFGLLDPVTNLNAVVATGAGAAIDARRSTGSTWQIVATGVTTGGTVKVQGSVDNLSWYDINTVAVSATGNQKSLVDEPHPYLRANVSARTDGTYTVKCALWEGPR